MRTYEVKPGDSAWSITYAFTGSGARWGELIAANPQKPTVPDGNFRTLQPGEILNIPDSWAPDSTGRVSKHPTTSNAGTVDPPDPNAPQAPSGPPPSALSKVAAYNGRKWLGADFFSALMSLAADTNQNPANYLVFFYSESTVMPWAADNYGGDAYFAVGLNQFTSSWIPAQADRIAWTKVDAATQVKTRIRDMFTQSIAPTKAKRQVNAQVLYAYNFLPGIMKDGGVSAEENSFALTRKGESSYDVNSALDANGDGVISVGDLGVFLQRKTKEPAFVTILAALNEVAATSGAGPFSPTFGVLPVGGSGGGSGSLETKAKKLRGVALMCALAPLLLLLPERR